MLPIRRHCALIAAPVALLLSFTPPAQAGEISFASMTWARLWAWVSTTTTTQVERLVPVASATSGHGAGIDPWGGGAPGAQETEQGTSPAAGADSDRGASIDPWGGQG